MKDKWTLIRLHGASLMLHLVGMQSWRGRLKVFEEYLIQMGNIDADQGNKGTNYSPFQTYKTTLPLQNLVVSKWTQIFDCFWNFFLKYSLKI